jgi:uridylate kinase
MAKETIIISLGGSVMVPDRINTDFIKKFRDLISGFLGSKKFVICVGGGKIAREYGMALSEFGANDNEKDWAGINITWLNAQVIKSSFGNKAYPKVLKEPNKKIKTGKDIIVAGGWKPGWSTDYDAVLLAKNFKAGTIINLTNIDYVFNKNPREFPDAKPFKNISWPDFRKIVGGEWTPGLSMPFDPEASKLAEKLKFKVIIMNGSKLENFENFLNNKDFMGTNIC